MGVDFNWWLVLVGVVAGGALTWLVLADTQRREKDIGEEELRAEAGWIARTASDPVLDAERVERVLRAHRRYLRFPPPDTLVDPATLRPLPPGDDVPASAERPTGETRADA
jgi:hypothetical protein